jgi:hypothetical protein
MGLFEGIAGFALVINDLIAFIAFGCAVCIGIMAIVNLVYYRMVDAPWGVYAAFLGAFGFGVLGQVILYTTGKIPETMGALGQTPVSPIHLFLLPLLCS